MILLLLLTTGCRTTRNEEVYVPQLNVEVDRPILDVVPMLDVSDFTLEQQNAIAAVLAIYNGNLIKMIDYSNRLLEMQDAILDYYMEIIKVGQ